MASTVVYCVELGEDRVKWEPTKRAAEEHNQPFLAKRIPTDKKGLTAWLNANCSQPD